MALTRFAGRNIVPLASLRSADPAMADTADRPTDPNGPLIELAGLGKRFDGERALDGVSLDVDHGESVVIIGPSGSGKTVLLKTVIGLVEPDEGSVRIAGTETVGLSARARDALAGRIGMLFQQSALFDSLRVWENVAFRPLNEGTLNRRRSRDFAVRRIEAVGLSADTADLYPVELSGGMRKRAALARAIANDPQILLLDEPTAGLDPIMSNVINDLILEIIADLGATVLSVTSDMAGARRIADRVAMMFEGRMIWQGPSAALDGCENAYVDQFVHSRAQGPIQMVLD